MTDNIVEAIRSKLTENLQPTHLTIIDDSPHHAGHAGNTGGGHFRLTIASKKFNDKPTIDCHRMIHAALGDMMRDNIHALQITIQR